MRELAIFNDVLNYSVSWRSVTNWIVEIITFQDHRKSVTRRRLPVRSLMSQSQDASLTRCPVFRSRKAIKCQLRLKRHLPPATRSNRPPPVVALPTCLPWRVRLMACRLGVNSWSYTSLTSGANGLTSSYICQLIDDQMDGTDVWKRQKIELKISKISLKLKRWTC